MAVGLRRCVELLAYFFKDSVGDAGGAAITNELNQMRKMKIR